MRFNLINIFDIILLFKRMFMFQSWPHSQRNSRNRQLFPWLFQIFECPRVRRRKNRSPQTLGRHVQIYHESQKRGLQSAGTLQNGGQQISIGSHRLRHEG